MKLIQIDLKNKKMLKEFVQMPYKIYQANPNWVPPMEKSLIKTIAQGNSMQLKGGPYTMFMVKDNGSYIARLLVGVNQDKNKQKDQNEGYFSLFECINDKDAAKVLLDGAINWLEEYGVDLLTGPISPTNGDDFRGVLISGFDEFPTINTTYTMDYYKDLFDKLDYEKYLDFYAFSMDFDEVDATSERIKELVKYGKKKVDLSIMPLNKKQLDTDIKGVYDVFVEAQQSFWEHLELPTYEKFYDEFLSLKHLLDPNLIHIARINNQAVGFIAGLPDYNQVLYHFKGKLNIFSILKFLYYRNKITRARMFMQFVIPKYQKSVVTPGLYLALYEGFLKKGYTDMEASTIAEFNMNSLQTIKGVGFDASRIYRIYKKSL
ncbi:MAG TPA: hypothetical protein GX705_01360 [Clostridiales bacterium]|nr:hypothetical protein [Clostridiales bacterium]